MVTRRPIENENGVPEIGMHQGRLDREPIHAGHVLEPTRGGQRGGVGGKAQGNHGPGMLIGSSPPSLDNGPRETPTGLTLSRPHGEDVVLRRDTPASLPSPGTAGDLQLSS